MIAGADLHRRLLTLDAHLDIPAQLGRAGWNFGAQHDPASDVAQVDLPRMEDGNLTGGFFVIYTAQGPLTPEGYAAARAHALHRSAEVDAMLEQFADRIGPALTAADARSLHAEGRLVAFKSMENGYPVGDDLAVLAEFQRAGVRLAGPVHGTSNQLADSATDALRWGGLSSLGERWVGEMNRLGMVIDGSHASDAAFDRMLALSTAPMLLSHSSARAIYDHPRNIDDARIRRLVAAGGAIGVATIYLSPMQLGPERAALFARLSRINALDPDEQVDLASAWHAMNRQAPLWAAGIEQYLAALLHVIDVAGVEGVCFGADWDGGGGVTGLQDITALPQVTARLQAAGYTDDALEKMWSGNLLRILDAAESVAARR